MSMYALPQPRSDAGRTSTFISIPGHFPGHFLGKVAGKALGKRLQSRPVAFSPYQSGSRTMGDDDASKTMLCTSTSNQSRKVLYPLCLGQKRGS